MAYNKFRTTGGTVLLDLTADSITPGALEKGVTAHDKYGNPIEGTLEDYDGAIDVKITFTIKGVRYLAKEGMTFNEWLNSSYNTAGYIISTEGDVVLVTDAAAENAVVRGDGTYVYATDTIGAGAAYTTVTLISFAIDGVRYRAAAGMTWYKWKNTIFNHDGYTYNTTAYAVTDATGANVVEYNGDMVYYYDQIVADAVYTTATLITFTIAGSTYCVRAGMTWYEWANSSYNRYSYYNCFGDSGIVYRGSSYKVKYNGTYVYGADVIVADAAYTQVYLISFTIGETSYQAESGMTWHTWVNSSYNTDGYICSGDTETDTVTDANAENTVQYNAVDVYATDALVSGAAYTTASVSTEA